MRHARGSAQIARFSTHSVVTLATRSGGYLRAGCGPGLLEEVIQPLAPRAARKGFLECCPLGCAQLGTLQ
jgi:hypothetical protein